MFIAELRKELSDSFENFVSFEASLFDLQNHLFKSALKQANTYGSDNLTAAIRIPLKSQIVLRKCYDKFK